MKSILQLIETVFEKPDKLNKSKAFQDVTLNNYEPPKLEIFTM